MLNHLLVDLVSPQVPSKRQNFQAPPAVSGPLGGIAGTVNGIFGNTPLAGVVGTVGNTIQNLPLGSVVGGNVIQYSPAGPVIISSGALSGLTSGVNGVIQGSPINGVLGTAGNIIGSTPLGGIVGTAGNIIANTPIGGVIANSPAGPVLGSASGGIYQPMAGQANAGA